MELSEAQKKLVDANWDKMDLNSLTKLVFEDDSLDGRSKEGKLIKEYLGDREVKTAKYKPLPGIELTEEQKEYIKNNVGLMRAIEMARVLFPGKFIQPLGMEVRAITKFSNTLGGEVVKFGSAVPEDDYRPPSQLSQVVKKVNEYAMQDFDINNINAGQRKMFEVLRSFLHSPRFVTMINSYTTNEKRIIFESEFIRSVWNQPDLTADELNLYVNLCANYVMMITINGQLDLLNEKYTTVMQDPEGKLSIALSDMIKVKTEELNKCDKRQSELIEALNGKRSARKQHQKQDNVSIVKLIEWWRDEKERKKALEREELRKKDIETEIDRIEKMDELKARIFGISRSELLNG